MMANVTIRVEGLEAAISKLDRLGKFGAVTKALKAAALHVKGKVNVYPPETMANSPANPSGRWYQRGFGPRWRSADGSVGGRKLSQTLGRKWTIENRDNLSVAIGNNVTYGPFVQDPDKQARFMGPKGWKTTKQVADEEAGRVETFVLDEIAKELES